MASNTKDLNSRIVKFYEIEAATAAKISSYYNFSYSYFLDFKVLAFQRYREVGLFSYSLCIFISFIAALSLPVIDSMLLILTKLIRPRLMPLSSKKTFLYIAKSVHGEDIIRQVSAEKFSGQRGVDLDLLLNRAQLLSWRDTFLMLPRWCIFLMKNRSMIKWLYGYDYVPLLSIMLIVEQNRSVPALSDSHFQRWALIFASISENFHMCQHGKISSVFTVEGISGNINTFYYRDFEALEIMRKYYRIDNHVLHRQFIDFKDVPEKIHKGRKIIFLASSLPHFDKELAALKTIMHFSEKYCVIYKLHPSHVYGAFQKIALEKYSELRISSEQYPACDIMICAPGSITHHYEKTQTKIVLLGAKPFEIEDLEGISV